MKLLQRYCRERSRRSPYIYMKYRIYQYYSDCPKSSCCVYEKTIVYIRISSSTIISELFFYNTGGFRFFLMFLIEFVWERIFLDENYQSIDVCVCVCWRSYLTYRKFKIFSIQIGLCGCLFIRIFFCSTVNTRSNSFSANRCKCRQYAIWLVNKSFHLKITWLNTHSVVTDGIFRKSEVAQSFESPSSSQSFKSDNCSSWPLLLFVVLY